VWAWLEVIRAVFRFGGHAWSSRILSGLSGNWSARLALSRAKGAG
jgi:hypothetical protein